MEFLNVENLCKAYGKGDNQVLALDHVSLTIDKGDFIWMARTCTHRAKRSWPSSGGGRWD